MKTIPAFAAIQPSGSIRIALGNLQQRLERTGANIRWVPPENIHLTLAFLGELPEEKIEPLVVALDAGVREKTFKLSVAGTGTFGKPHYPRVLWAGVKPCPELARLQEQTTAALRAVGVEFDEKPFSPHLTLGRFKSPRNIIILREQLETEQGIDLGSAPVHALQLIQSKLSPDGAKYRILHRFPLLKPLKPA